MAASLALAACAGAPARTGGDPRSAALESAFRAVDTALSAAHEAGEGQEAYTFSARYNPTTACACPEWEIRLRGRWTRVFLESTPDRAERLRLLAHEASEDHAAGGLGEWAVTGTLADDWRRDDVSGLTYPVLRVDAAAPRRPDAP